MVDPHRKRVPVAPYQRLWPNRRISAVMADYSPTVTVYFADGHTARAPKIGDPE